MNAKNHVIFMRAADAVRDSATVKAFANTIKALDVDEKFRIFGTQINRFEKRGGIRGVNGNYQCALKNFEDHYKKHYPNSQEDAREAFNEDFNTAVTRWQKYIKYDLKRSSFNTSKAKSKLDAKITKHWLERHRTSQDTNEVV